MSTNEIYNFKLVNEQVLTGGQPTEAQLQAAAAEGVRTVINLATINPRYSLEDEAGSVAGLGMTYVHIPVEWERPLAADFAAFAAAFATAMQMTADEKVLVHCAANYRVTAFISLYAMKHWGWTVEQADGLMAHVWQQGQFPVWDALVAELRGEM
jgi:protein tyrosine phosphatase (PTP) superfamily phosphohydrolase (DUF442 family)